MHSAGPIFRKIMEYPKNFRSSAGVLERPTCGFAPGEGPGNRKQNARAWRETRNRAPLDWRCRSERGVFRAVSARPCRDTALTHVDMICPQFQSHRLSPGLAKSPVAQPLRDTRPTGPDLHGASPWRLNKVFGFCANFGSSAA